MAKATTHSTMPPKKLQPSNLRPAGSTGVSGAAEVLGEGVGVGVGEGLAVLVVVVLGVVLGVGGASVVVVLSSSGSRPENFETRE